MTPNESVTLKFQPEHKKSDSDIDTSSNGSRLSVWYITEIQDFIRRLGFIKPDEDMRKFLKLNEVQLFNNNLLLLLYFRL